MFAPDVFNRATGGAGSLDTGESRNRQPGTEANCYGGAE